MIGVRVGPVFVAGRPTRAAGGLANVIVLMLQATLWIVYWTVWAVYWVLTLAFRGIRWCVRRRRARKLASLLRPPTGPGILLPPPVGYR